LRLVDAELDRVAGDRVVAVFEQAELAGRLPFNDNFDRLAACAAASTSR
jgi:hypothetical protein